MSHPCDFAHSVDNDLLGVGAYRDATFIFVNELPSNLFING